MYLSEQCNTKGMHIYCIISYLKSYSKINTTISGLQNYEYVKSQVNLPVYVYVSQNTVGPVHQSGRSWYDIQCKLQGTVALASSVFMQMADAMEGSKSQWGSECLRMWAADGHH